MLIVALVLAVIGLAALVTAVVTSNEMIAWVCIGASVIGVVLLIVDALRERSRSSDEAGDPDGADPHRDDETTAMPAISDADVAEDYPDESVAAGEEPETRAVPVESGDDADSHATRD